MATLVGAKPTLWSDSCDEDGLRLPWNSYGATCIPEQIGGLTSGGKFVVMGYDATGNLREVRDIPEAVLEALLEAKDRNRL